MGGYFLTGFIIAIIANGLLIGFADLTYKNDKLETIIGSTIVVFIVLILGWGILIPLAGIAGAVFLTRAMFKKKAT